MSIRLSTSFCIAMLLGAVFATEARTQPTAASPSVESEKVALIREIIAVTKVAETTRRGMTLGLEAQKMAQPNIPAVFWEEFQRRAESDIDKFLEMVIPIYDRHFTTSELQELLRFYKTPLGRQLVAKLPVIMEESTRAGQEWGMRLGEEVGRDLVARGLIKVQ
jgi:hypothetical protein